MPIKNYFDCWLSNFTWQGGRNFNLVVFSHVWIKIYSIGRDYTKEINIAIRQKKHDATWSENKLQLAQWFQFKVPFE